MRRYWIETLGCPKNQVDSDKLEGRLVSRGYASAASAEEADLVVVNTCAFIDAAREESVEAVLALSSSRAAGAKVVVTGCMAERYGEELAEALPEVDLIAPFGVELDSVLGGTGSALGSVPVRFSKVPAFDLLNLPRPKSASSWAYVKVAEGCDRRCGFCAIPSFRGKQRSRPMDSILAEVGALGVSEAVLVAQDLASWGRDRTTLTTPGGISDPPAHQGGDFADLVDQVSGLVPWTRLLYLYPSSVNERLIEAVVSTGVSYFDLSLQHASRPLLARMRRWGSGERFLAMVEKIRQADPTAALRSSFVVGYPGETEEDHDELLAFLSEVELDWAGFFAFSPEAGTYAAGLDGAPDAALVAERLAECAELQEEITFKKRLGMVGRTLDVLIDAPGVGRSYAEAPEIDGIIEVPTDLAVGSFHRMRVTSSVGPDLQATPAIA